ncbi:MAG: DsbA family protein [Candidatus Thorarchaeota archaeon]
MKNRALKVIVYSDYICPFCYIGFHRIERLKEQYDLDVEWRSYELHPEIPKNGLETEKLSFPRGYLEMIMANVQRLAEEDGLKLNLSNKLPNSQMALFISEFAKKQGKFDEFHKLVFDSYWKEGKDIGDLSLLLNLAESIGLSKPEILNYIRSDEPVNKLKAASFELESCGINGVPTFFIGNRVVFGAQPYGIFQDAIERVLEDDIKTI